MMDSSPELTRLTSLIPKKPHGIGALITIISDLTARTPSNMTVSSYDTSLRDVGRQHATSSKLPPSPLASNLNSPGPYAQFNFTPTALRRAFKTPAQVTTWSDMCLPEL